MHGQRRHRHSELPMHQIPVENIAAVYNQAGEDYVAYADGDPERLFSFEGLHAYADRRLWSLLETKLSNLRATGASSVARLRTPAAHLSRPAGTAAGADFAPPAI